ncbi:MAG: thiosulfate oxidation carrier protein SoxY [Pseudomonadota bacterium]
MDLTRRETLVLGAAAAAAALPKTSQAAPDEEVAQAIQDFTKGAELRTGEIEMSVADIADNGFAVPITVSAPGAREIVIIAPGNPIPRLVTFRFGKFSKPEVSTKIRMAQSQDLMAIAKLADGTFTKTEKWVIVTVGGCGAPETTG